MAKTEREYLLESISDLSKDAYGFRVRRDYDAMSDAELEQTYDSYIEIAEERNQHDAFVALQNQKAWEQHIDRIIELGARDRATAIRWDMVALGELKNEGCIDVSYYCFLSGIDYALESRINSYLE